MGAQADALDHYLSSLEGFKRDLFGLYEGVRIKRKVVSRGGGWTWGYVLVGDEGRASGSSVGEDELKLFLDLCLLTAPDSAYVIGHAFGVSTFALALAAGSGCRVVAIDNWNDGKDPLSARELSLEIVRSQPRLANVRLFTGASPSDTPAALEGLDGALSLIFIDAQHTDRAALDDYAGCQKFMDQGTVCLWHNVDSTHGAFETAWSRHGKTLFDRRHVLHTYGPLGVFFNSDRHPRLDSYLRHGTLIWHDWQQFLPVIRKAGRCRALLERDERLPARVERRLRRTLAGLLRRRRPANGLPAG